MASKFREVWVTAPDGQTLCALINAHLGWLMYLRDEDDPGFSSRNPDYAGNSAAMLEFRLNNGQVDEFPVSWTYPVETVDRALDFFRANHQPPPFIHWYNDSGDGATLI